MLSASLFVVATVLAALMLIVLPALPYENVSPDERQELDWLAVAGPTLLGLAIATIRFVWISRPVWAAFSYAAYAIVGLFVLRFILTELSQHGDTALLAFAFFIGIAGLLAVVASFGSHANP